MVSSQARRKAARSLARQAQQDLRSLLAFAWQGAQTGIAG
jgi:hypothetical protein